MIPLYIVGIKFCYADFSAGLPQVCALWRSVGLSAIGLGTTHLSFESAVCTLF